MARELGEIGVRALVGELHGGLDHGAHFGVERVQRRVVQGTLLLQLQRELEIGSRFFCSSTSSLVRYTPCSGSDIEWPMKR